ncbi:MAG: S-layer homology domain-containing protein [Firmicutes bacterium]|nr:S-layer homology domain-containing protein [Bacillota bacterium]
MKKQIFRTMTSCFCAAAILLGSAAAGLGGGAVAYGAVTVPKDVTNHWAKSFVTTAIEKKIVSGYDDGTFRPDKAVSRAEFSHMLNAALGNTATTAISFSDVKSTDWYYGAVQKAVAAGYVSGYDNGTFKPGTAINRQEAAVMLSRIIPTYNTGTSLTKFKDASAVSSWASDAVSRAVGSGYISGTGNGTDVKLDPLGKLTRAQAVVIICKLLENETIVKTLKTVSDDTTLKDAIYSNGITVSDDMDGALTISNCVVLGKLNIKGGDTVTVTNSRVASAVLAGDGTELAVKGETSVKTTAVTGEGTLSTTSVAGSSIYSAGFESVTIDKDAKAGLNGKFSNVTVSGENAVVSVEDGSTVSKITVNGKNTAFKGTGTVSLMTVNADGVTYEKRPSTLSTAKTVTTAPKLVEASLTITADPKDGTKDVKPDSEIKLTFSEAIKTYSGETISDSDVDELLELRVNSSSGNTVGFEGDINSSKTVITITPDETLESDTTYYITMAKNRVKTSEGEANGQFIISFTTESVSEKDAAISFFPKDDAENVKIDTDITISFSHKVMNADGSSLKSEDLEDIIIFRETNSKGDDIDFTATINSAKTKITVTPKEDLEEETQYYLAVDDDMLITSPGKYDVDGDSVTWTTAGEVTYTDEDFIAFSPKDDSDDVELDEDITITFDEKVICEDGSSVSSSDLQDIVIFRKTNSKGDDVEFTATINSAKTKITITPEDDLEEDQKYYLAIAKDSLLTSADKKTVAGASVTWTTVSDEEDIVTFSPKNKATSVSRSVSPTITFDEAVIRYNGNAVTASYVESNVELREGSSDGDLVEFEATVNDAKTKITIDPTSKLEEGTKYYLSFGSKVFRTKADETKIPASSVSWTVTGGDDEEEETSDLKASRLSSLTLSSGSLSFKSTTTTYNVTLDNGTTEVTVTAKTTDGSSMSFDGSNTSVKGTHTKKVDVSSGKATTKITVFDGGKSETTYTINFTVNSDTGLNTLTVNGTNIKSSLTYSLKAADKTTVELYIKTADSKAKIVGGTTDVQTRKETITVDYGKTVEYRFTVVSTNGAEKDYKITLKNPNKKPS